MKDLRDQRAATEVELLDYAPAYQPNFKQLNVDWIERYFRLEAADHKALDHPEKYILQRRGHIWLARHGGQMVGTCALLPLAAGTYELAKMTVIPTAQGLGVGFRLGTAAIAYARALGTACTWKATPS